MLALTNVTAEECKMYKKVLEKFDLFFQVRINLIYERARFNQRRQQSGENAEQYIMAFYDLTQICNQGQMLRKSQVGEMLSCCGEECHPKKKCSAKDM